MSDVLILDIKGNSLDDGPGIRSTVFFKGCPLRCIWCHNPESKRLHAELSYDREACIGCGTCRRACPVRALDPARPQFVDRSRCTLCFACADVCPSKALSRVGRPIPIQELLDRLLKDKLFYDISGGGVTLSGGEATMHLEWTGELARRLKEKGVNVLLETCGLFDYDRAEQLLLPYLKDIYCDIKLFDRDLHRKYCGVSNERILSNIRRLQQDRDRFGYSLLTRVPLIPGITDTEANLTAIAGFMAEAGITETDLLPYNPTWYSKTEKLGDQVAEELQSRTGWQSADQLAAAKQIFTRRGISLLHP